MAVTNSPNMNLPIPVVGVEPGPQYATDVNSSLTIVDSHDHTPGKGVQITPDSININAALTLNDNLLTSIAGLTLQPQGSTPGNGTIYESGVDLYFVDGFGNNVRITQSGAVAGTPGSIANLVPPASASYVSLSGTFVWQAGTNVAANMDFGAALMRNTSPNSTFALTLQPPALLSADYTITLPVLPVAQSVMLMNTSGNILNGFLDNSTLVFASQIIKVASQGITAVQIANQTITATQIANQTITDTQIVPNTISASSMANNGFSIGGGMTVFNTAGTFTFTTDAKTTRVIVAAVGGGGGGGGPASSGAKAGGEGCNEVITVFEGLTPSTGYTVIVGAGGAGNDGHDGGDSLFNGVVVCRGAQGATGTSPGAGSGYFNTGGGPAAPGQGSNRFASSNGSSGGGGGSSSYGIGGNGGGVTGGGGTPSSGAYGAGGGGAGTSTGNGGAGMNGQVIVYF